MRAAVQDLAWNLQVCLTRIIAAFLRGAARIVRDAAGLDSYGVMFRLISSEVHSQTFPIMS